MKLVMTLLVRDEEDILAATFDFHLSQGVDLFIVTDNLSVDGTRDIIADYVRLGVAVCLHEPGDDYAQFRWVTRMARMAATLHGADWVINSDADEFWVGGNPAGRITDDLASVAPQAHAVTVPRSNFVPVDEDGAGFFAERMTLRERASYNSDGQPLSPKICHRAFADIDVDQGNHGASRAGVRLSAVTGSLRILHYPMRSYRQFERKIASGGAAYGRNVELPYDMGRTWRDLHARWQAGGLPAYYRASVVSPPAAESRLASGDLVRDETVLSVLRHRGTERVLSVR